MNVPHDPFPTDDELSKAFDVDAPEPSTEHIRWLRAQIASHINLPTAGHGEITTDPSEPSSLTWPRLRVPMSLAVVAALLLAALLTTLPFAKDAAASLHDTLRATREARWIHGSTTFTHAQKTFDAESWCSPAERIVAFRSPHWIHFVSYELGIQTGYSETLGKVYQWEADPSTEGFGRDFVFALLNDQDLQSSFPLHDVSKVHKSTIDVNGKSGTRYSFHVQMRSNPDIRWETTVTTDPESGGSSSGKINTPVGCMLLRVSITPIRAAGHL